MGIRRQPGSLCRNVLSWSLSIAVFVVSISVHADTIRLKDGSSVVGNIVGQTGTSITVRTKTGQRTIPKSAIARISYGPVEDEEREQLLQKRRLELIRQRQIEQRRLRRARLFKASGAVEEAIGEIRSIRREDVLYERNQALWRSALIPGWGHFYLDEYEKSLTLLGMTAFSYSVFTNNYIELKKAERAYNSALVPPLFTAVFGTNGLPITIYYFDALKRKARRSEDNLNQISWLAVLLWTYSIADVYYNHDKDFKLSLEFGSDSQQAVTWLHPEERQLGNAVQFAIVIKY